VIPALYDHFSGLNELPDVGMSILDGYGQPKYIDQVIEQATVNRSGRAGVKQYGLRQTNKRVDNNELRALLADYTPRKGWIPSEKRYRLRRTHKDPALGTDQLVLDLGSEFGTYTGPSSAKYVSGRRSKEGRGFGKAADGLGLRPGTLDACHIKKVRQGSKIINDSQDDALWNAFDSPKTFNKQVEAAAVKTTAGIVGLKGQPLIPPLDTIRDTKRCFEDNGKVNINKSHEERYLGHRNLPEGKLSRTFLRMPNKPRDIEAMRGIAMQKDKVKVSNGEIVRKSQELVSGWLPESSEPLENILEHTWNKMTPARRSSSSSSRKSGA
jgi:hypothetical protein